MTKVKSVYESEEDELFNSLFSLLEVFWQKFFVDYVQASNEERIDLARDMFENNGLKQYLEFVQAPVVPTTVHAAKGLEWERNHSRYGTRLFPQLQWWAMCPGSVCIPSKLPTSCQCGQ